MKKTSFGGLLACLFVLAALLGGGIANALNSDAQARQSHSVKSAAPTETDLITLRRWMKNRQSQSAVMSGEQHSRFLTELSSALGVLNTSETATVSDALVVGRLAIGGGASWDLVEQAYDVALAKAASPTERASVFDSARTEADRRRYLYERGSLEEKAAIEFVLKMANGILEEHRAASQPDAFGRRELSGLESRVGYASSSAAQALSDLGRHAEAAEILGRMLSECYLDEKSPLFGSGPVPPMMAVHRTCWNQVFAGDFDGAYRTLQRSRTLPVHGDMTAENTLRTISSDVWHRFKVADRLGLDVAKLLLRWLVEQPMSEESPSVLISLRSLMDHLPKEREIELSRQVLEVIQRFRSLGPEMLALADARFARMLGPKADGTGPAEPRSVQIQQSASYQLLWAELDAARVVGDKETERRAAEELLKLYPDGPLSSRAEAVLGRDGGRRALRLERLQSKDAVPVFRAASNPIWNAKDLTLTFEAPPAKEYFIDIGAREVARLRTVPLVVLRDAVAIDVSVQLVDEHGRAVDPDGISNNGSWGISKPDGTPVIFGGPSRQIFDGDGASALLVTVRLTIQPDSDAATWGIAATKWNDLNADGVYDENDKAEFIRAQLSEDRRYQALLRDEPALTPSSGCGGEPCSPDRFCLAVGVCLDDGEMDCDL